MLVVVLLVLLIGVSYSIYNYNFLGSLNLLEKEMIELELLEDTTEVINLSNELPISDTEGKAKGETFNFAVTTRTKAVTNINYGLKIEKLSVDNGYTSLKDNDIKIYLTDYEGNALITPTRIGDLHKYTFYQDTNSHSKENDEIVDKFKLRAWIDWEVDASDWNENTKLQYKFKIGVEGEEYDYDAPNLNPKGKVPDGAIYANFATGTFYDEMPEIVSVGDGYLYGEYVYSYGYDLENNGWEVSLATEELFEQFGYADAFASYPKPTKTQTSYEPILESINGVPVTYMPDTFGDCTLLEIAPVIPSGVKNMSNTFDHCISLKTAPIIPDSVTNMFATFRGCLSLVTAPAIPDGVTNMNDTFLDCTSLKTAPVIPNSVTDMSGTFFDCTSLVTPPDMSKATSVTDMSDTFSGCTSLVTAPEIPNGVTNMSWTFSDCTSLTGDVEVNANPTSYDFAFSDTVKPIKITGTSSATTKANLAGTANNGNVTY